MFDILQVAQEWLQIDPNPSTRGEIEALVQERDVQSLERRMRPRIMFGTAGLRACMEAGYARMNDVTVLQASQGVAHYFKTGTVVIGFDHRERNGLSSRRFAQLAAAVFKHHGFKVYLFGEYVHTPMVPFAVKTLNASCGIMITASHNPKQDNGYKLYAGNGCLITSPMDQEIAKKIEAHLVLQVTQPLTSDVEDPTFLVEKYMSTLHALATKLRPREMAHLQVVYTAMHGVAWPFFQRALVAAELTPNVVEVVVNEVQSSPDPDFPTVAYPNPEEGKGALSSAMTLAEKNNIRYVLAHDPDGDRLAVAEHLPSGDWHVFTGDQLGVVLAEFALEGYRRHAATQPEEQRKQRTLACLTTTVSSNMLSVWGKANQVLVEETLTGFKWLSNRAEQLEQNDAHVEVMFAYEEAIGFMFRPFTDKDGVSAGICLSMLLADLAFKKTTLMEHVYALYRKYGCFVSQNGSVPSPSPQHTHALFRRLRTPTYPTHLGTYPILSVRDISEGYDSSTPNHMSLLPKDCSANAITFTVQPPPHTLLVFPHPCRITLRASGTEPKIKYYTELPASAAPHHPMTIPEVRSQTATVLNEMVEICITQWLDLKHVKLN